MEGSFDDGEIEVAEILAQLPRLVLERDLSSRVTFSWGSRRRRSGLSNATLENDNNPRNRAAEVPHPPTEAAPPPAAEEANADAPSPTTPLSFSPSESDGKRKRSNRKSRHKKTKEEWDRIIEELTEEVQVMKREIGNVGLHYDKLKAFNLELKAKKEEAIKPKVVGEIPCGQAHDNSNEDLNPQPLMKPRLDLPDLNEPVDESIAMETYQPLDLDVSAMINNNMNRLLATEARRKRIQICRRKNSVIANKFR